MDELTKKKHNLYQSMMKNPVLAKNFAKAMKSEIGSTTRQQFKPTFSVMVKASGMRSDGQGGPIGLLGTGFMGSGIGTAGGVPVTGANFQPNKPETQNFGNLTIYPAVKLKQPIVPTPAPNKVIAAPEPVATTTPVTTPKTNLFGTSTPFSMRDMVGRASPISTTTNPFATTTPTAPVRASSFDNAVGAVGDIANFANTITNPTNAVNNWVANTVKNAINPPTTVGKVLTPYQKSMLAGDTTSTNAPGLPYQQGILGKAVQGIAPMIKGVGAGLGVIGSGLAGGVQYLGQNISPALQRVGRFFGGYDPNEEAKPFTSFGDTWGAGVASNIINGEDPATRWSNLNPNSPSVAGTTQSVSAPKPIAGAPEGLTYDASGNVSIDSMKNLGQKTIDTMNAAGQKGLGTDVESALAEIDKQNGVETIIPVPEKPVVPGAPTVPGAPVVPTPTPTSTSNPTTPVKIPLVELAKAIISQESGGDYGIISPAGALGKYQIMPFNLGYAGLTDSKEDQAKFLATPALQDKAFTAMISELNKTYGGDSAKILAAYYGGAGGVAKLGTAAGDVKQGKFPSINEYVNQVLGKTTSGKGITFSGTSGGTDALDPSKMTKEQYAALTPAQRASIAIKSGTSSAPTFAVDETVREMGGNQNQVADKIDQDLRAKYRLEEREQELSDLKTTGKKLVPTLTDYITGKDQYLKEIDALIAKTEAGRKDLDMGNPLVEQSYRKYLAYLYTLKGRQNKRYGDYLNSAITDYNAQVTDTQSEYDKVYADYTKELTSKTQISMTDYQNKMNSYAALYQKMEDLPKSIKEMKILDQQIYANDLQNIKNAGIATAIGDSKLLEDEDAIFKNITDKDGNIAFESIGPDGIPGILNKSVAAQKNPSAAITAVKKALANAMRPELDTDKNPIPVPMDRIMKIKKLVDDLKRDPDYGPLASEVMKSFVYSSQDAVSTYVSMNTSGIKSAVEDVVNKKVSSASQLISKHTDIDPDILTGLYEALPQYLADYGDPKSLIDGIFAGSTTTIGKNIAEIVTKKW